jgi:hypothetical protein
MSNIDPTLITLLVGTGLLASVSQLILAFAAFIRQKANKVELSAKIDVASAKVDDNTVITKATQASTDGIVAKLVGASSDAAFKAGQKDQVDRQAEIQNAVDAAKEKT